MKFETDLLIFLFMFFVLLVGFIYHIIESVGEVEGYGVIYGFKHIDGFPSNYREENRVTQDFFFFSREMESTIKQEVSYGIE